MKLYRAIVTLAGLAVLAMSGLASAQSSDPNSVLNQSSTLLKEQQELDARISASRSRLEELKQQEQRLNQETQRLQNQRETNQSLCGSSATYWSLRAECDQQSADLSNAGQTLNRQQRDLGQSYQSATSETKALQKRQEALQQQSGDLQQKLKGLDVSSSVRDCMERMKKDNLSATVSAYQQCSEGGAAAQSQLRPEERFPSLDKPGPIEQMGIEDEKRRKRKQREAERGY